MDSPPLTPQKPVQLSPSLCSSICPLPLTPTPTPDRKRKHQDVESAAIPAGLQLLTPPLDDVKSPPARRRCHGAQDHQFATPLIDHEAYGHITQLSTCTAPQILAAIPDPLQDSATRIDHAQVPSDDNFIGGCTTEYDEWTFDNILQHQPHVLSNPLLAGRAELDSNEQTITCSWSDRSRYADNEICFGMIRLEPFDPKIKLPPSSTGRNVHVVSDVQLTPNGVITLAIGASPTGQGSIPGRLTEILSSLEQQNGVTIQLHCVITQTLNAATCKNNVASIHCSARLFAIIYGPESAFDSIGDFLDACGPAYCLQDPQACIRNVPYRNPHRITGWDDEVPMTIDRAFDDDHCLPDTEARQTDDWNEVALHGDLPLTSTPPALKSQLYAYQSQALSFMHKRERGWDWGNDIWTRECLDGQVVYRNSLTDEYRLHEPAPFRGGLLADQMGLGKTLTIIALVASDMVPLQPNTEQRLNSIKSTASNYTKCTLVIVPPNLLSTWDDQLRHHTNPGEMQWSRHHDTSRFCTLSQLEPYNIIITTYNTVATEWRSRRQNSLLYSTHWHRIVLDEAHCIREERTQLARAICDLKADRRWAVTGTPIQNHLSDLEALLKFLQVDPYNNHGNFVKDIVKCWETDSQLAVDRLKRLICHITLRRTSKGIDLPPRTDHDLILTFNDEERACYDAIERQTVSSRPNLDLHGSELSRIQGHKVHGLHLLRFICNFGTFTNTSHFCLDDADGIDSTWNTRDAQNLFNTMVASGMTKCSRCIADALADTGEASECEPSIFGELLLIAQCGHILCANCSRDINAAGASITGWCDCTPGCPVLPIPLAEKTSSGATIERKNDFNLLDLPTKTRALIDDILIHSESKSVVFSAWRTTLDIAERAFDAAGIRYTRFDGEVKNQNDRALALEKFRSDPGIRVILITLSCGAVGLDLTVANRAYMMEPQWNPTVEEQALARVHRMGQRNPVTTVRFIMGESIEKKVIEVQNSKRSFADVLLCASKRRSTSKTSVDTFGRWKTLLK